MNDEKDLSTVTLSSVFRELIYINEQIINLEKQMELVQLENFYKDFIEKFKKITVIVDKNSKFFMDETFFERVKVILNKIYEIGAQHIYLVLSVVLNIIDFIEKYEGDVNYVYNLKFVSEFI